MTVVKLDTLRKYKEFHENRQLDLTQDTIFIHNNRNKNIGKEYRAAWMKLLTRNIQN